MGRMGRIDLILHCKLFSAPVCFFSAFLFPFLYTPTIIMIVNHLHTGLEYLEQPHNPNDLRHINSFFFFFGVSTESFSVTASLIHHVGLPNNISESYRHGTHIPYGVRCSYNTYLKIVGRQFE